MLKQKGPLNPSHGPALDIPIHSANPALAAMTSGFAANNFVHRGEKSAVPKGNVLPRLSSCADSAASPLLRIFDRRRVLRRDDCHSFGLWIELDKILPPYDIGCPGEDGLENIRNLGVISAATPDRPGHREHLVIFHQLRNGHLKRRYRYPSYHESILLWKNHLLTTGSSHRHSLSNPPR